MEINQQLQEENRMLRQRLAEVEADRVIIKNTVKKLADKYGLKPSGDGMGISMMKILPKIMQTVLMNPSSLEKDFEEILPIIQKYSHE